MADQPEALGQIGACRSFDEARAATSGVSKTAALWAAALVIVWVSGLEPTWRSVITTGRAFREINVSRQKAERQTTIRLRRVIAEKEEVKRLKQFEQQYHPGPQRDQARAKLVQDEKKAKEKLEQVKGRLPGQDRAAACEESKDCQKAQAAASRAINEMQQFVAREEELKRQPLAEREKNLANEEAELKQEADRLKNRLFQYL